VIFESGTTCVIRLFTKTFEAASYMRVSWSKEMIWVLVEPLFSLLSLRTCPKIWVKLTCRYMRICDLDLQHLTPGRHAHTSNCVDGRWLRTFYQTTKHWCLRKKGPWASGYLEHLYPWKLIRTLQLFQEYLHAAEVHRLYRRKGSTIFCFKVARISMNLPRPHLEQKLVPGYQIVWMVRVLEAWFKCVQC